MRKSTSYSSCWNASLPIAGNRERPSVTTRGLRGYTSLMSRAISIPSLTWALKWTAFSACRTRDGKNRENHSLREALGDLVGLAILRIESNLVTLVTPPARRIVVELHSCEHRGHRALQWRTNCPGEIIKQTNERNQLSRGLEVCVLCVFFSWCVHWCIDIESCSNLRVYVFFFVIFFACFRDQCAWVEKKKKRMCWHLVTVLADDDDEYACCLM